MTALQFRGHAGRSCRTRYLARKYDFRPRISSSLGRGPSSQRRNDCASPYFRPPEPPRRPPPPATLTCTTPPLEPEPVNSPSHHQVKLSANVHTVVGGRRYHLVQSDASLLSPTGETHSQQHAFVFGTSSPETSETPPPFVAHRPPPLFTGLSINRGNCLAIISVLWNTSSHEISLATFKCGRRLACLSRASKIQKEGSFSGSRTRKTWKPSIPNLRACLSTSRI